MKQARGGGGGDKKGGGRGIQCLVVVVQWGNFSRQVSFFNELHK